MKNKIFAVFFLLVGCAVVETKTKKEVDFYTSQFFRDVQLSDIFPDSKTFVDCTPKRDLTEIISDYNDAKEGSDFVLSSFVKSNFDLPVRPESSFLSDTAMSMEEHLTNLWPVLTRKADEKEARSSLIALPYDYVVPGGRFSEIYYWDSYFTILGLKAQKRYDLIQNMVNNFAFLIDTIGFIPNGNRNYYLTRSQPPFFSVIIRELEEYDSLAADRYLNAMVKEYSFWMNGSDSLKEPGDVYEHVVMMNDSSILNRYYDRGETPRPEAYKEDFHLAEKIDGDEKRIYRDIRAAAESGWDFSSRWFADGRTMETIHTTDIIPVDLNCLLAHLEQMISRGYALRGDEETANLFHRKAVTRRQALIAFSWDAEADFFMDFDWKQNRRTGIKTLAGTFPLFFLMAENDLAKKTATTLERDFLKQGGLVTSLVDTDQQWDSPNGWAPLQWVVYRGLKNYQQHNLANEIRKRWLRQSIRVFEATGKMMEKYNVTDTTLMAGGGEYPNQDGFGWTNGVSLAFIKEITISIESSE